MKKIALILFIGALAFTACSPTEYTVSREVTIDAPAAVVFAQVNNHKNRDAWSPWERMDPNMSKTYEGPESGVGAKYAWSGNDSVGTGNLEIIESTEPTHIESKLVFTSPWESTSSIMWDFTEENGSTKAVWTIKGELPGYLFWMGQDDMDEAMGPDFERGLDQLKAVAEAKAAEMKPKWPMEMVSVEAHDYYHITEEVPFSAVDSAFFADRYGQIMTYLGKDSEKMTMPPFAVYHKWDEENKMAEVSVSIACTSSKPGMGKIKKDKTYAGRAMKMTYMGNYEDMGPAHELLHKTIENDGMEIVGSPWEVYITDPGTEPNPDKWITEIYYPVTKKSS